MLLADTAGLRDTTDTIEQEGIRRARHYAEQAQLRLWLFDPTQEHTSQQSLWSDARPGDFVLWTKTDEAGPAPKQLDGWTGPAPLALSARSGEGIPALLEALKSRMLCDFCDSEDALLARARHREALVLAQHHLVRATEVDDLTLKAEDIRLSIRALSTVIGVVGVDDILDVVFSAFCLGK
jgi:tRNA modification GTPase